MQYLRFSWTNDGQRFIYELSVYVKLNERQAVKFVTGEVFNFTDEFVTVLD